jgi:hypothetical protein
MIRSFSNGALMSAADFLNTRIAVGARPVNRANDLVTVVFSVAGLPASFLDLRDRYRDWLPS